MSTLSPEDCELVIGSLDSLGVALADYNHQWSDGERAIYEEAMKILENVRNHDEPARS